MRVGLVTKRLFQHPRELGQFARLFVSGSAFAALSIALHGQGALQLTIHWDKTTVVSKSTPTLQVVVNPLLRHGEPLSAASYKAVKELGVDYLRFVPWLPYPRLGLAELEPPTSQKTSWDFSLIDPMTKGFLAATEGHTTIVNFSTMPTWLFKTDKPVTYPADPNQPVLNYTQGTELRDPTGKEMGDYYERLTRWYVNGGDECFDVQTDCSREELRRAASTSAALNTFVARPKLDMLAHYHIVSGNAANEDNMSSIILGSSLPTARHIPVAGEYEVRNALAMKIMDALGAGVSFTEYYAIDFNDDLVLMGQDGPGHTAICEGKTKVRPLKVYHGKVGRGLSVEMSLKHGPATLLSVAEDAEFRFKLVVAEGECVAGEILEIGNTNSQYCFPIGARGFVNAWNQQGPAHHCAIGAGHVAATLKKTAELMGIGFHQIC